MVDPISTTDIKQPVRIRMGEGQASIPPMTIMECWEEACTKRGDKPALFQKKPKSDGTYEEDWTSWTWKEYRQVVDSFAKSLVSLGCNKYDIINIIGFNSPEWFFGNFGAIAAGCVPAGIYTTNLPEACEYISQHSKAKVVLCEGIKQLSKYYGIVKNLPSLKALVVYGPDEIPANIKDLCSVPVYKFDSFLELGKDVDSKILTERSQSWKYGETCTLIYTSGTTGPPKAVMITNDNITWTVRTQIQVTRRGTMDESDVMISYLPLSHVAAAMLEMYMPLMTGTRIYFACAQGNPWAKLQEVAKTSSSTQKTLSSLAKMGAGSYWDGWEYDAAKEMNLLRDIPVPYYLSKVLLSVAHKKLGFDRCHSFYVSAAPIETKILKYFMSLDIPIMELFGQSECTGPHAVNLYSAFKVGSVGRPLPGTETKLVDGTGELCYRGRHIFAGYMGMPDKTKDTIDSDGWLHSGDIARIDDDKDESVPNSKGFVFITGRIKELIITAGGENVPPVLIEDSLKTAMPCLSNAMVIGDKRKFLSVLLCLQVEIDEEGVPSNKLTGVALDLSKELGSKATTTTTAKGDPLWQDYFSKGIEAANKTATSRAQKVSKYTLLETDFTEKGGELTPTLKLKRSVTADKYGTVIEAMYT